MSIDTDMLLLGLAILALFYSIILSHLQERKGKKLLRWVKMQYPDVWLSMPWALRHMVTSYIGLLRIKRAQQIDNAYFNEKYAEMKQCDTQIFLSLFCSGAILLLISY